ncbi:hypothetical protein PMIN02_000161 [Paraphaeosphaeria minitans]
MQASDCRLATDKVRRCQFPPSANRLEIWMPWRVGDVLRRGRLDGNESGDSISPAPVRRAHVHADHSASRRDAENHAFAMAWYRCIAPKLGMAAESPCTVDVPSKLAETVQVSGVVE